jgi:hypothetical protein
LATSRHAGESTVFMLHDISFWFPWPALQSQREKAASAVFSS